MKTSNELFLQYRVLVLMVKADHESSGATMKGHDFYHAWRVANCALQIAPDDQTGELAWVAAMLHNTDHLTGHAGVESKLLQYLDLTKLDTNQKSIVINAVQKHSGRNDPEDSHVLICLKDADKVVNMEVDVIMRASQFRSNLPIVDPRFVSEKDPSATHQAPKTILRDLQEILEWVDQDGWFRTPKALQMAQERAVYIRLFFTALTTQLENAEVLPPNFPNELLPT